VTDPPTCPVNPGVVTGIQEARHIRRPPYHAIALWVPGLGVSYAYVRLRSRLAQTGAVSPWSAPEALAPTPAGAWS
jgi:hypothetical protein